MIRWLITLLIGILVIVVIVLIIALNPPSTPKNKEAFGFGFLTKPPYDNQLLITRGNAQRYFKGLHSNYITVVLKAEVEEASKTFDNLPMGSIIFITDDKFASSDKSAKNHNNFLDLPNISLCISEDWFGPSHPKLFLWPIGLETTGFEKTNSGIHLMSAIEAPQSYPADGVMCNAHFATYPNPASGYRDDRDELVAALQSSSVDFWKNKVSPEDCFSKTKKYAFALCPEGNGLDTHRFYETFALGLRPIVRKGPLTLLHSQFPGTIIVNEWQDVEKINKDISPPNTDLKYITLSFWLYNALRSRCRIVNFFTGGLCVEWKNLMFSIRRLGLQDLVIAFALDQQARECILHEGMTPRTELMSDTLVQKADHGTPEFRDITAKKVKAIGQIVKEGYFTFYLDTDIVLFKDPIKDYFTYPPAPVYMQSDTKGFENNATGSHCTGVVFIAPSSQIAEILENAHDKIMAMPPGAMEDQAVLNQDIADIKTLSPEDYPNGHRYFKHRGKCSENPVLVHNNWIVGQKAKINRFKKHNLWFDDNAS